MDWQRKVKSAEGYLTESRYTSERLRESFGKKPADTLKQREAMYAKDRETVNLNWLMDDGNSEQAPPDSSEWLESLHRSLDDATLEGEQNAKYDEMERELFNAVEALESQKSESLRVKNELVKMTVERDELIEALRSKPRAASTQRQQPPVSVEELKKLKEDVKEMVEEATKREKVEQDLRILVQHSEERCEAMERKWLEEQRIVEAELKRMSSWKAEAEKGLDALEKERDTFKKNYEDSKVTVENLKEEILALKEGKPLEFGAVTVGKVDEVDEVEKIEEVKEVVVVEEIVEKKEEVEDEEEKEREAFRAAVAAWRVDTEDTSKASKGDKILTARKPKSKPQVEEEEESSTEILDVLADIETDEQYTAPPETLSPTPPTPNPKPLLLRISKSVTSSPGGHNSDDDSEKSIEWEASSLTPGKSKSSLMSSASTAALQMINARPKASIKLSKPITATVPKAKPSLSPKRKGKGKGKRVSKSPKKREVDVVDLDVDADVDVDVDVEVKVEVDAEVDGGGTVAPPRMTPDSPLSPPIPPRRKKKPTPDPSPSFAPTPSPPAFPPAPPISYTVPKPKPKPKLKPEPEPEPAPTATAAASTLVNPPEISRHEELPQHLIVTQELQMKYAREKTPDRKKKKKKKVGTKKAK
ncbi:hypothetical protein TrVE_jg11925 [Triparma verrucosa]|uniref:Uncharacterized protein n=1 Tax=Triparma verrucosa TaxID=1606542 RepID=A0A9W7ER67_9STRA|nr:hypothetical protein TrVE_jg11925 [Triparma verrucosa]